MYGGGMDGAGVLGGQVERLQEELRSKDEMMRYVEEEVRRGEGGREGVEEEEEEERGSSVRVRVRVCACVRVCVCARARV